MQATINTWGAQKQPDVCVRWDIFELRDWTANRFPYRILVGESTCGSGPIRPFISSAITEYNPKTRIVTTFNGDVFNLEGDSGISVHTRSLLNVAMVMEGYEVDEYEKVTHEFE
jgi:hypothetical protein